MESMIEISLEKAASWEKANVEFVDIRNSDTTAYGTIPGAVLIPMDELEKNLEKLDRRKKQVLYCSKGIISGSAAERLREK